MGAGEIAGIRARTRWSDMGYEEARLVLWLRKRFKDDPEVLEGVESIVRQAADTGTMAAMDSARDKLLCLVK